MRIKWNNMCEVPCVLPYSKTTSVPHSHHFLQEKQNPWRIHTICWKERRKEKRSRVPPSASTACPPSPLPDCQSPLHPGEPWLRGGSKVSLRRSAGGTASVSPTAGLAHTIYPPLKSSFAWFLIWEPAMGPVRFSLLWIINFRSPSGPALLYSESEMASVVSPAPWSLLTITSDFITLDCNWCRLENLSTLLFHVQRKCHFFIQIITDLLFSTRPLPIGKQEN